jgi:hypothetical protein
MNVMIASGSVGTSASPEAALGLIFAVAAGFFAVAAYYYFRVTAFAERVFVRRTRVRLRRSSQFLQVRRVGRLLWLIDVLTVIGLRGALVFYLGLAWFVLVPLLMTIGSVTLAASLIHF